MLTTIMKWVSIAALLTAAVWHVSEGYHLLLQFAICAGALLVVVQSYKLDKFGWGIGFFAIAIFINPIAPPVLPRVVFLLVDAISLGLFLVSLYVLKNEPRLSIASITDRTPGSESL